METQVETQVETQFTASGDRPASPTRDAMQIVYIYLKTTEAQSRAMKKYQQKPEVKERARIRAYNRYHAKRDKLTKYPQGGYGPIPASVREIGTEKIDA